MVDQGHTWDQDMDILVTAVFPEQVQQEDLALLTQAVLQLEQATPLASQPLLVALAPVLPPVFLYLGKVIVFSSMGLPMSFSFSQCEPRSSQELICKSCICFSARAVRRILT